MDSEVSSGRIVRRTTGRPATWTAHCEGWGEKMSFESQILSSLGPLPTTGSLDASLWVGLFYGQ